MPKQEKTSALKKSALKRITAYSQKISAMGHQVRQRVFGFRRRSTLHIDRWSLPVKLLHDHRLVQRRRAFHKGGGAKSGVALHAMEKVRHKQKP